MADKDEKKEKKGFATPILVRKPDGQNKTIYVDPKTGLEVNPENYEIVDQYTAHLIELGLEPDTLKSSKEKNDEADAEKRDEEAGSQGFGSSGRTGGFSTGSRAREASNNYGYISKPGFLNVLGMVPHPAAQAINKALNLGINVNNDEAADTVRSMLGMKETTGVKGLLSSTKDNKGYIGDVTYGDATSPVGFEAEDKMGRTTLTPNEARMRQALNPSFHEATADEKAATISNFSKENPTNFGKNIAKSVATNVAKGAITGALGGNIFGGIIGALAGSVKSYGINVAKDAIGNSIASAVDSVTGANESSSTTTNRGLGSLSPSFNQGISYSHEDTRGAVTKGLTERSVDTMNALAANSPTGLNVTSAYRSPAVNAAVGGAKKSLHMSGDAFDVSTAGLTDAQKRDMVERSIMAGAQEIGTYPNESLHIGTVQRTPALNPDLTGGVTAMYDYSRHNYDQAPGWFKAGVEESQLAPTPTARPETETPMGISAFGAIANVDLDRANRFTDTDRLGMAMTLAGEVDLSKTDLTSDIGKREAYGILSTIENRADKYGSILGAIEAPNQYSTWNTPKAASVAEANYAANPGLYNSLVESYTKDPTSNLGFTSYYNPKLANPSWGQTMEKSEDIGAHRFGVVAGYNFGETQMSKVTQQSIANNEAAGVGVGVSAMANIDGTGWGKPSAVAANNLSGFSSSVSGENANRSNTTSNSTGSTTSGFGSSTSGSTSTGFGSPNSSYGGSKDSGLGGTSSTAGGGFSSAPNSSYGGSKDSGLGGTSAATGGTTSTGPNSSYGASKDSGLGGTSATSAGGFGSPSNKGDSSTSSGRLGGRV